MEDQPCHACEQTKSKQKQNQFTSDSNYPCVLLFDLAQKQCNGIIKRWLHCLTSELKPRFLVNKTIFVWFNMMPGRGANLILFNIKNKDSTSRTLADPHPLYVRLHLILFFI